VYGFCGVPGSYSQQAANPMPPAAQDAVDQQDQQQDEVPETEPLLARTTQPQPALAATPADVAEQSGQQRSQPSSPTKAAAQAQHSAVMVLNKQGSSFGRVKSQELGQCRYGMLVSATAVSCFDCSFYHRC
jgi:hypothetical protein